MRFRAACIRRTGPARTENVVPVKVRMLGFIALMQAVVAYGQQPDSPAPEHELAVHQAPPAALYTHDDLKFLQHMIVHHQQAQDMAALVPERTTRESFVRFARYVADAQSAEIVKMDSLLDIAADRGLDLPDHLLHDDPPMAGMLSRAEMERLASSRGAEFERLWLDGMIYHHEGALAMARAQQRHQLATGRRPFGIDVLVEDILVEQREEIARMRAWLEEWGLALSPQPEALATPR
jgi:uncharacterized protein (DUF305 family)